MPLTTACPVRYILIDVDGTMEWHPLPPDVDARTAVITYLANDSGIDCSEISPDAAWLVTLGVQDGQPIIAAVELLRLPAYNPDKHPNAAQDNYHAHAPTA